MKGITRLHPRKTQHYVHNCLNLNNCCGSKWCTSTYTSTFNNNIWNVLQRVGHLLHNWTLFSSFLVNSPEKADTACQAFPLFIASPILDNDGPSTSIGSTSAEGWHWRLTNSLLPVESPDPSVLSFGIWPLGIHAFFPVVTVPSNMISMEAIFRKPFLEMVVAWGHACMYTTNSYDTI